MSRDAMPPACCLLAVAVATGPGLAHKVAESEVVDQALLVAMLFVLRLACRSWHLARGRARLCTPYPEQSGRPAFGHTPYPGLPHHRKTAIPLPRAVRGASHTIAGFTTLP